MGDIRSAIADDEDEYRLLCKELDTHLGGFTYDKLYELRAKYKDRQKMYKENRKINLRIV
jgi:hypothetical protein